EVPGRCHRIQQRVGRTGTHPELTCELRKSERLGWMRGKKVEDREGPRGCRHLLLHDRLDPLPPDGQPQRAIASRDPSRGTSLVGSPRRRSCPRGRPGTRVSCRNCARTGSYSPPESIQPWSERWTVRWLHALQPNLLGRRR